MYRVLWCIVDCVVHNILNLQKRAASQCRGKKMKMIKEASTSMRSRRDRFPEVCVR